MLGVPLLVLEINVSKRSLPYPFPPKEGGKGGRGGYEKKGNPKGAGGAGGAGGG